MTPEKIEERIDDILDNPNSSPEDKTLFLLACILRCLVEIEQRVKAL